MSLWSEAVRLFGDDLARLENEKRGREDSMRREVEAQERSARALEQIAKNQHERKFTRR